MLLITIACEQLKMRSTKNVQVLLGIRYYYEKYEKREGVIVFLISVLYKNNWFIIVITFFMVSRSNDIIVAVEECIFTDSDRY